MPRRAGCLMHFGDFANILKAFIGSNYLGVAYAFKKSGLVFGVIGLIIIAVLTDHCCHLIVKAKYHAMRKILAEERRKKRMTETSASKNYRPGNRLESSGYSFSSDSSGEESSSHAKIAGSSEGNVTLDLDEINMLEQHMMKHMSYGDVGRISFGKTGLFLVNVFIATTQFCFCVAYFIFIGNTIHRLLPIERVCDHDTFSNHTFPVSIMTTTTTVNPMILHDYPDHVTKFSKHLDGKTQSSHHYNANLRSLTKRQQDFSLSRTADIEITNTTESTLVHTPGHNTTVISFSNLTMGDNTETTPATLHTTQNHNDTTTAITPVTIPELNITTISNTTEVPSNLTTTEMNITTAIPSCIRQTIGPSLMWLVASPLPLFLVFALIRSIRRMSWISIIANFSILGGCVAVFAFIVIGFKVNRNFQYFEIEGVPIFFGMVTAAFEGIGLIIPVESSMDGNRHNFSAFLHGAIGTLVFILGTFGIMGYLRFADGVDQMINLNIPSGTFVFYVVNLGVCVGVLLTFPLQIYPVIDLIEIILFSTGSICGPKCKKGLLLEDELESSESLLPQATKESPVSVAVHIPESVPAWKRNIVRMFIVSVAGGLAIIFRDSFAYVGAFTGAVGSSSLAFILPCLFHFKLCRETSSIFIKIKDLAIIVFGIMASVISLYYVVLNLIQNTKV